MKLFAWKPKHHGPLSFFVMAESEADASKAVGDYLAQHIGKDDGHFIAKSELNDWVDGDYKLTVLNPGEVIINAND